jgi:hypothetical protein
MKPGNVFALASRTSQIISGYRNYLSEMETVPTMKNQQLVKDMNMLRDSLGVQRGHRGGPPPEPEEGPTDVASVRVMDICKEWETRSNKYASYCPSRGSSSSRSIRPLNRGAG